MHKNDRHAFVNQLLVYTLVMICFTGSIGLGTVWLRNQMALTANSIKSYEYRTAEVERRLAETSALIGSEQSPATLIRRNEEWRLGLVAPTGTQIVRGACPHDCPDTCALRITVRPLRLGWKSWMLCLALIMNSRCATTTPGGAVRGEC